MKKVSRKISSEPLISEGTKIIDCLNVFSLSEILDYMSYKYADMGENEAAKYAKKYAKHFRKSSLYNL